MNYIVSKKFLIIGISVFILILVGGVAGTAYFYYQYKNTKNQLDKAIINPQGLMRDENARLIKKIKSIIDIPNEEPTIAIINDLTPVANQPFFQKAKVGDRLIIFPKAKEAILFDPIAEKIVEVGPINPPATTPTLSLSPSPSLYPKQPSLLSPSPANK